MSPFMHTLDNNSMSKKLFRLIKDTMKAGGILLFLKRRVVDAFTTVYT